MSNKLESPESDKSVSIIEHYWPNSTGSNQTRLNTDDTAIGNSGDSSNLSVLSCLLNERITGKLIKIRNTSEANRSN